MSMGVITEQQVKAQVTNASSKQLDRMTGALDKFEKCSSAHETRCKMDVMGLSDKDAIYVLGLNESKVNK